MGQFMQDRPSSFLLYDGECPVCSRFVLWSRIKEARPEIRLLDARQNPDLVAEFRSAGIEINDTMLLRLDGKDYVGADAMAALERFMPGEGLAPRLLRKLVASRGALRLAYPVLVRLRKLLLALMGRSQIR